MVDYQITEINGFFREGWKNGGKASLRQASEKNEEGKLY
jgi:hypothetical protein